MAVTVISRPIGHKLSSEYVTATALEEISGAVFIFSEIEHGLSTGDYVYIESDIESYNGFKYVQGSSSTSFHIRNSIGSPDIDFKQQVTLTYRVSEFDHGWQCVHLPIVYELSTDLQPNTLDPIHLIDGHAFPGGYTSVNITTPAVIPEILDYILFTYSPNDDGNYVSEPYQVIATEDHTTYITIIFNKAQGDFGFYSIQKYYNNYHILVNIYGGLESGHPWEDEKPFELLATLKFIPDSSGKIRFSISEILKGQIKTRNNLTLDTLPNNLDFYTQFYITYSESYDESDGSDITVFTSEEVDDSEEFIGEAVNAMLPFKTVSSGHMTDYINSGTSLSRWLTVLDRPMAFVDRFFDLSFLLTEPNDLTLTIIKSLNGVELTTDNFNYIDMGLGVIRMPITIESGYDEYCAQVSISATPEIPASEDDITIAPANEWIGRMTSGGLVNWSAPPGVVILDDSTSEVLYTDYAFIDGSAYDLSVCYDATDSDGSAGSITATVFIMDSSYTAIYSESAVIATPPGPPASSSTCVLISFVATSTCVKIGFRVNCTNGVTITKGETTGTITIEAVPASPAIPITESICIDIIDECQNSIVDDNLRLMEGGEFRALE